MRRFRSTFAEKEKAVAKYFVQLLQLALISDSG
jgi:hypothetical protein